MKKYSFGKIAGQAVGIAAWLYDSETALPSSNEVKRVTFEAYTPLENK